MAVGRITGPLLKANLLRNGVNLAFETNLLYLDVINGRVGIKTTTPAYDLDINGTTRTSNLNVTTQANLASFTISGNTISSTNSQINLTPNGASPVVYQGTIVTGNLQLSTNVIATTGTNTNLNITTTGTGVVNVNSDMLVNGNLHATGNITADGNITLGANSGDTVTFDAEVNSNIIPSANNTYDLGSNSLNWANTYTNNVVATNVTASTITGNGINLTLPQGNIYYVATNGSDSNAGVHENNPFATIAHALSVATSGTTVYIYPGTYTEIFPMTIPAGVAIRGAGIRAVTIQPTSGTISNDAFLINGQITIEDLSINGQRYNSGANTGYAFKLANNFITTSRSPYIRNVSVITRGTPTQLSVGAFISINNAAINYISSLLPSLLTNTPITPLSGNTQTQNTSLSVSTSGTATTMQALIANIVYVINNGAAVSQLPTITNDGAYTATQAYINAAAIINANVAFLKAQMSAWINATYPTFYSTYSQTKSERDLGTILTAITYDITHGGNDRSVACGIGFWTNPSSDPYGFSQADAGGGAYLDGSVATVGGVEVAVLFHSITFICPNRNAVTATNGVRIEWLNSFSYFANYGIYLISGSTGIGGAGLTRLEIPTKSGTWAVGNTVTSYDPLGSVLATGTIASISGNYINISGYVPGFATATSRTPKVVTANGNAKLSTALYVYGGASLSLDGSSYVSLPSQSDFNFGASNYTIEFWAYRTGTPGATQILFDMRASGSALEPVIYLDSSYQLIVGLSGNANAIRSGYTFPLNSWVHIALSKSGTSAKLFANGTQYDSTFTDSSTHIQSAVCIGARQADHGNGFIGYIDDLRICNGIGLYTTTFSPPSQALTGNGYSVLLLHFDGPNNSSVVIDDPSFVQNIQTNAGGTATAITFANYNDFGSEFRSIGSAMIYGNYGVYGNGQGITAYLISTNFAYVGAGNVITNDPTTEIVANQITQLNGANIYYTSVDNQGNFNVGAYFNINQKTGAVTFNGQALNITSYAGVTFTDGTHTTTLLPTSITTGNIEITGNTIESITGDINVVAYSNQINLQNNTTVTGNLTVNSTTTVNGNITLGTNSSNTVTFNGAINTNFVPYTTNTYNLGTSSYRWNNVYVTSADINGLTIASNVITTTATNADLQLQANGTGRIYIPNNSVQIDQSLTVTNNLTVTSGSTSLQSVGITGTITQTGDFNQTGNFTTSGNTQVTGNITATGTLTLPQITISGNTISTSVTNTDINLIPNGTGSVVMEGLKVNANTIQAINTNTDIVLTPTGTGNLIINSNQSLQLPVGSTSQQPGSPATGMVRYNNVLNRYEGWSGSYWTQLSGVIDIAGLTKITPELTPGAGDNTIRFYINGSVNTTLDSSKLYTPVVNTNNITISSNTITTLVSGSNINISTPGAGSVVIGNLSIQNNNITNIVSGAVTQFIESGSGYVKIGGTGGVVIPSGTNLQYPAVLETGMTRFNTDQQLVEVYNGVSWTSVAGTSAGVTAATATDISITNALLFG